MLELTGVATGYGKNEVLEDLGFAVSPGEIVALLGPNGAGKTTTVRVISGLISTRRGVISYNGVDISMMSPRERIFHGISVVPEGRSLFFGMTVEENLEIGAFIRHDRATIREDKQHWFDAFPDMVRLRKRLSGSLSGGEQSIAAFGRGMMSKPSMMVLDEPSLGIAPKVLAEIGDVIKRSRDETGLGCLLVEQDIPFALSIADRVLVMTGGHITGSGTPDDFRDGELLKSVYLGIVAPEKPSA
ncbi:MAG: ABC transporter ATP-binding protein [Acidimicrobiales bacterium]